MIGRRGVFSSKRSSFNLSFLTYLQNITKTGTTYQVDNVNNWGRAISDETFAGDFEIIWDILDPFVQGYGETVGLTDNTVLDNNTVLSLFRSGNVAMQCFINTNTTVGFFAYVFGDKIKIKRVGTAIIVEVYNAGAWTVQHTFAAVYNQTFRFKYRDYGDGIKQPILYNPRYNL